MGLKQQRAERQWRPALFLAWLKPADQLCKLATVARRGRLGKLWRRMRQTT